MQMSRMMFVDMPGSERLAMDPEVLLLREGVLLNKSLLDFARGKPLAMTAASLPCTMGTAISMQLLCAELGAVFLLNKSLLDFARGELLGMQPVACLVAWAPVLSHCCAHVTSDCPS